MHKTQTKFQATDLHNIDTRSFHRHFESLYSVHLFATAEIYENE